MKSHSHKYPRQNRIRKRAEFLACYENGQKFHSSHFLLFMRNNGGEQRFGTAVSRKTGNAVQRNRVKRLLREFFRLNKQDAPNSDMIVVAKKGAGHCRLCLQTVEHELLPLLRRMRNFQS